MSDSALIDDLERQFAENPRRVFARLANEYRKAGDAEHAIEICLAHVPQQPGYISGHIVLGQALFDTSRFDEAKGAFETALGLDPENLIALRQLGDIARETGGHDDARSWYRRLLEVDPQNEEIASQLSALDATADATADANADATPDVQAPDAGAVPDQEPVRWGDIHPDGASTEPEPAASDSAFNDVGLEVEQAFPTMFVTDASSGTWDGDAQDTPADPEPTGTAPDGMGEDQPAVVWDEVPVAPPIGFEPTATDDFPGPLDLPAVPPVDTFVGVAAVSELPPSWSDGPAYDEPGVEAAPPAAVDRFDAPSPEAITTPTSNDPELPDAFVTETMADLYRQQGFNERALEVYHQLAEQYPDNARFQEQIAVLQDAVAAARAENASSLAAMPGDGDDWSGVRARGHTEPTIRAFLSAIAARRVTAAPGEWTPPGSVSGGEAEDVDAVAEPEEEVSSYEEPSAREDSSTSEESFTEAPALEDVPADDEPSARDELSVVDAATSDAPATDGLFPGWAVSSGDDDAGGTLADAYADDVQPGDGRDGTPAHRASDELSLDAVFRDSPGRERSRHEGPSVSFDEFFADDDGHGHDVSADASGGNGRGEAGTSADLELFHAWLEGLKK